MDSPASLMGLPNELIAKIVCDSGFGASTLTALRLTCRQLQVFASRENGKLKFADVSVILTPKSLKKLIDSCKHPQFGTCIRRVQLSSVRMKPTGLQFLTSEHAFALRSNTVSNTCVALRQIKSCASRCLEERTLEDHDEGIGMLIDAFEWLARHGDPIHIAVSYKESPATFDSEWHNFDYYDRDERAKLSKNCVNTSLNLSILSANHTGCNIQGLSLDIDTFQNEEDSREDLCIEGYECETHLICSHLKYLKLEYLNSRSVKSIASFRQILSAAESLDAFELSQHCLPSVDRSLSFFDAVADCLTSNTLKTLILDHCYVSEKKLVDLLLRHRGTILEIRLDTCELEGSWAPVISCIREQVLSVGRIILFNLEQPLSFQHIAGLIELNGKEEIQSGLGTLLKRM